jgi:hypothetical protein
MRKLALTVAIVVASTLPVAGYAQRFARSIFMSGEFFSEGMPNRSLTAEGLDAILKTADVAGMTSELPYNVSTITDTKITELGYKAFMKINTMIKKESGDYRMNRELGKFFADNSTLNYWKNFEGTKGIANFSLVVESCLKLNEVMTLAVLKTPEAGTNEVKNAQEAFTGKYTLNATDVMNNDVEVLDALRSVKDVLVTLPVKRDILIPVTLRY